MLHCELGSQIMNEHLIIYMDLLGARDAIHTWDNTKRDNFIQLLHNLAHLRSEFDVSETPADEGVTQVRVTPAVTTFSDHIVISYPMERVQHLAGGQGLFMTLHMAEFLVARVAVAATGLGLLVRGGATVGRLYHSGGVVLGEALVEAYELESRVSVYPRIAVSRKLYSQIPMNHPSLVEDHDGIRHLSDFRSMIFVSGGQPGDEFKQRANAWLNRLRGTIADNIREFEQKERWNELAKWVWFRGGLEQARAEAQL
jgi:hypothetical protein